MMSRSRTHARRILRSHWAEASVAELAALAYTMGLTLTELLVRLAGEDEILGKA